MYKLDNSSQPLFINYLFNYFIYYYLLLPIQNFLRCNTRKLSKIYFCILCVFRCLNTRKTRP